MDKYRILIEERESGHKYYMPQTKVLFFLEIIKAGICDKQICGRGYYIFAQSTPTTFKGQIY